MEGQQLFEAIEEHVAKQADQIFKEITSKASSVKDLREAMWEKGKQPKGASDIEQAIHELIYRRFSVRVHELIKVIEDEVLKKALPQMK